MGRGAASEAQGAVEPEAGDLPVWPSGRRSACVAVWLAVCLCGRLAGGLACGVVVCWPMGGALDPRQAVLVGVGAVNQSADAPGAGLDTLSLIVESARLALADAGATKLGPRIGRVYSTGGLTKLRNPAGEVATGLGAPEAHTVLGQPGIAQQSLINAAVVAIESGLCDVAVVCGGETRRRDDIARRAGITLTPPHEAVAEPDETWTPAKGFMGRAEVKARLVVPVLQYAMIDNARRAARGWSIDEHRDDIAELWSRFSAVAASNPDAAFGQFRPAEEIREPGQSNRPLAFPYNKWLSSQWSVDQAASLVFASVEAADDCGSSRDRWVFPAVAVESTGTVSLSQRAEMHRWPAMGVLGQFAASHLNRPLDDIGLVELYSCFPAAVRVQQGELGLPENGTPTVTGGMGFAGGPMNNFVLQSTAAMARRVRSHGETGLVTGVSGLLTKPGLTVYEPRPPRATLRGDLNDAAAAATPTAALADDPAGRGRVATYTVAYEGLDPVRIAAIVDLDDDRGRAVALLDDPAAAAEATRVELIGASCEVQSGTLVL